MLLSEGKSERESFEREGALSWGGAVKEVSAEKLGENLFNIVVYSLRFST